ncbi:hypothetical protein [Acidocella sp. KAb 2-4]|nr:hypothetical protein [Acidocella sp. KAb 2-4]MCB5943709.1 hypothetical protein [Acidocella sp. KAb 2-4]
MSKFSKPVGLIFRASITLRDGKKIYARDHGLKGFPIFIRHESNKHSD